MNAIAEAWTFAAAKMGEEVIPGLLNPQGDVGTARIRQSEEDETRVMRESEGMKRITLKS